MPFYTRLIFELDCLKKTFNQLLIELFLEGRADEAAKKDEIVSTISYVNLRCFSKMMTWNQDLQCNVTLPRSRIFSVQQKRLALEPYQGRGKGSACVVSFQKLKHLQVVLPA